MATQTINIPLKNYRDKDKLNNIILPSWVRTVKVELSRCTTLTPTIWPNESTYLNIELQASFDNGATWIPSGGWGAYGGIYIRRDGSEAQFSSAVFTYPGGGILSANIDVINGPCRTEGTIVLSDV